MHGIVFVELEKFVKSKLGAEAWPKLLTHAGLSQAKYKMTAAFPDEEALKLVGSAVTLTGMTAPQILEAFGDFIAGDLLQMYSGLLKKEWSALDVIENTEATIHSVVRQKNPGAAPPALEVKRVSPRELVLVYRSQRKMCDLAKGLAKGVGRERAQPLTVEEPECMHRGASACRIHVRSA